MLEVEIKEGKLSTQLHPVKQQEKSFELSLLQYEEKEEVFNRISTYNSIIADQSKLKNEWNSYVDSKHDMYLNYWSPLSFIKNRYLGAVLRRQPLKFINKKGLALYLNVMRCEAHRDMSEEVIGKYLKR